MKSQLPVETTLIVYYYVQATYIIYSGAAATSSLSEIAPEATLYRVRVCPRILDIIPPVPSIVGAFPLIFRRRVYVEQYRHSEVLGLEFLTENPA